MGGNFNQASGGYSGTLNNSFEGRSAIRSSPAITVDGGHFSNFPPFSTGAISPANIFEPASQIDAGSESTIDLSSRTDCVVHDFNSVNAMNPTLDNLSTPPISVEPRTGTTTDFLYYVSDSGCNFHTDTIMNNFQGFTKNPDVVAAVVDQDQMSYQPDQDTVYPDLLYPFAAPETTGFVRPEYINLEVNRIAQPGPVSHPDKNFRPYGTNNWFVILHDHTLLRFLSNSEVKEIRDHAGDLANLALFEECSEQQQPDRESQSQVRLIGQGPYNNQDATQVWTYCQAYLSRRGQMRNNNAARRSRMKKEAETHYWKSLALAAGVPDHEYVYTEEEELAAIARADIEVLAKAQQESTLGTEEAAGMNSLKRRHNATGRGGRGRKAAKKFATATAGSASSMGPANHCGYGQLYAPSHGLRLLPQTTIADPKYSPGCGQDQYYHEYAPSPLFEQQIYGHSQQSTAAVTTQSQPSHRFNTRSRTRAVEQSQAGVLPVTFIHGSGRPAASFAPSSRGSRSKPCQTTQTEVVTDIGNQVEANTDNQEAHDNDEWINMKFNI